MRLRKEGGEKDFFQTFQSTALKMFFILAHFRSKTFEVLAATEKCFGV